MSAELLREMRKRLRYARDEGAFYRLPGFRGVVADSRLGTPDAHGSMQATFLGKRYQVSHLVWLWETGVLPVRGLSRVNGDPSDDRFENLALIEDKQEQRQLARHRAFVKKAAKKFPHHDLSEVVYTRSDAKVRVRCPEHGWFERWAGEYLKSEAGCPECCMELGRSKSGLPNGESLRRRRQRDLYRNILARALRAAKERKGSSRSHELLGYSVDELRRHVEVHMEPWMSWDNHGEWHLDHVVPVSWFAANGVTDPGVINALDNLRPISAHENMRKHAKLPDEYAIRMCSGSSAEVGG